MAENEKAENTGAAPASFDPAAFMNDMEDRMGKLLDARAQAPQPALSYPYASPEPVRTGAQPAAADPMKALLTPYLEEAVGGLKDQVAQANLRAQSAEDRAAFYAKHPEIKPDSEVGQRIEQAFGRLLQSGSPFVREDILKWEIGGNFDKYRKQAEEAEKAERDRAAGAVTVGPYSTPINGGVVMDPYSMTDDQLALAIKDKAF